MTTKIRKSVFETNSSSSHSLTLSANELSHMPFSKEVLKAGTIQLEKGEYGWKWQRYYEAAAKLNYLLTQLVTEDIPYASTPQEAARELCEQNPQFEQLCRVVKNHTGVEVLVTPGSSGYIDHESVGVGLSLFKDGDDVPLKQFLFSDAYVETGNDNGSAPVKIHTDRGPEDYYAHAYGVPEAGDVEIRVKYFNYGKVNFFTEKGAPLDEKLESLELAMTASGVVTKADCFASGRYDYTERSEVKADALRALVRQGLRVSKDLVATSTFTKTDVPAKDYMMLTLTVSPDVAEKLAALPTPRSKKVKA
jgi:hypothetical protein